MPNPFSNPPWIKPFLSHLPTSQPAEFTLATLTTSNPPRPTLRTCIFRNPLFTLPPNPRNPLASLNPAPASLSSSLLTFTTDARMSKAAELAANSNAELCFWIPSFESKPQWRIRGQVVLLSYNDVENDRSKRKFIASDIDTDAVEGNVSDPEFTLTGEGGGSWSWKNEVLRHFANLGPGMRGTFANPAPGTVFNETSLPQLARHVDDWMLRREFLGEKNPQAKEDEERGEEEWQEARKVLHEALRNFRVGVVKVEGVDRVDLAERGGGGKRWVYERGEKGWVVKEVWP